MQYIAIFASGTGGHVYPAYAMAMRYIDKGYKILWIGTDNGLENRVIKDSNIIIKGIRSSGVRGKSRYQQIKSVFNLFISTIQAFLILSKFKPSLALGFGGYVSVGPSICSFILQIPLTIHEQNSIAGTANRINYYLAKKVYETYPSCFNKYSDKIYHTCNPTRNIFKIISIPEDKYSSNKSIINVLVMGGSQGALFLNNTMPFAFSHFHVDNIFIKHIAGKDKTALIQDKYKSYGIKSEVIDYSNNIDELYDWSDLIIGRAGSTSISEISKIGRALVLVPFKYATDNHQLYNAKYLADNSAAILLEEKDDFIENFITIVNILLNDQKRMYALSKNIQSIFPNDAENIILNHSMDYIK